MLVQHSRWDRVNYNAFQSQSYHVEAKVILESGSAKYSEAICRWAVCYSLPAFSCREILMTASAHIKTPAMDVPLLPHPEAKQRGERLKKLFTRVSLSEVGYMELHTLLSIPSIRTATGTVCTHARIDNNHLNKAQTHQYYFPWTWCIWCYSSWKDYIEQPHMLSLEPSLSCYDCYLVRIYLHSSMISIAIVGERSSTPLMRDVG